MKTATGMCSWCYGFTLSHHTHAHTHTHTHTHTHWVVGDLWMSTHTSLEMSAKKSAHSNRHTHDKPTQPPAIVLNCQFFSCCLPTRCSNLKNKQTENDKLTPTAKTLKDINMDMAVWMLKRWLWNNSGNDRYKSEKKGEEQYRWIDGWRNKEMRRWSDECIDKMFGEGLKKCRSEVMGDECKECGWKRMKRMWMIAGGNDKRMSPLTSCLSLSS